MKKNNYFDEKIKYMDENYERIEPMQFYYSLFPEGSFQLKDEQYSNKANGMIVAMNKDGKTRNTIVYDERIEIQRVINEEGFYEKHRFAFMAPVTYIGRKRINNNAMMAYAITIDIDQVDTSNIINLMNMAVELKIFPVPTYVVVSGNGVHIYYQFEEPIPLYKDKYDALEMLKALITTKMWNRYTSHDINVQYQPITQAYRMPGSRTKSGDTVVAYATGSPVNIEDIIASVTAEEIATYRAEKTMRARNKYEKMLKKLKEFYKNKELIFEEFSSLCYSIDHLSLEEAKELHPEWYERRIVNGEAPGHYTSGKHLYYWWQRRVLTNATYGHRYFCILILVSYATRCNIPYEELEKDAYEMLDFLEALTPADAAPSEHFTKNDVDSALSQYGQDEMYRYSNKKIAYLTNIEKPRENKRNPYDKLSRKSGRELHAKRCSDIAKRSKENDPTLDKGGRPPVDDIVLRYMEEHPEETKVARIANACGVSRPTVYKYLQKKTEKRGVA